MLCAHGTWPSGETLDFHDKDLCSACLSRVWLSLWKPVGSSLAKAPNPAADKLGRQFVEWFALDLLSLCFHTIGIVASDRRYIAVTHTQAREHRVTSCLVMYVLLWLCVLCNQLYVCVVGFGYGSIWVLRMQYKHAGLPAMRRHNGFPNRVLAPLPLGCGRMTCNDGDQYCNLNSLLTRDRRVLASLSVFRPCRDTSGDELEPKLVGRSSCAAIAFISFPGLFFLDCRSLFMLVLILRSFRTPRLLCRTLVELCSTLQRAFPAHYAC